MTQTVRLALDSLGEAEGSDVSLSFLLQQLKLRELENLQTSKEKPLGMHTNSRHLFQESSKFLCVIVEGR